MGEGRDGWTDGGLTDDWRHKDAMTTYMEQELLLMIDGFRL